MGVFASEYFPVNIMTRKHNCITIGLDIMIQVQEDT